MRRHIHNGSKPKLSRVAVGMLALLIAVQVLPPLLGFHSPFGWATGIEAQNNPTACEAFSSNWTNCQDAFSSNDVYASAVGNPSVPGGSTPVTVQAGAGADPTISGQRHVFKATGLADDRYFAFYYSGSNLVWEASDDSTGDAWTGSQNGVFAATQNFEADALAVLYDPANQKVHAALAPPGSSTLRFRRGTVATAGAITWDFTDVTFGLGDPAEGGAALFLGHDESGNADRVWFFYDFRTRNWQYKRSTVPSTGALDSAGNWIGEVTISCGPSANDRGPAFFVTRSTGNPRGVFYGAMAGSTSLWRAEWSGATASTVWSCTEITTALGATNPNRRVSGVSLGTVLHVVYLDASDFLKYRNFDLSTGTDSGETTVDGTNAYQQVALSTDGTILYAFTRGSSDGDIYRYERDGSWGSRTLTLDEAATTPAGSLNSDVDMRDNIISVLYANDAGANDDVRFAKFDLFGVPGSPGKNDTAWRDFGFSFNPSDTIDMVEVGIEWFRTSSDPILNVTVSWDGGATWATNQTATNKSADDDTVEFLDFTSATAWDTSKLSDANFRVRVGTNASDASLDYVTARVNYNVAPSISNFRIQQTGSVQTQRDPTACELVGDNWTNCQDAFSSNDLYAYANGSAAGGDPITFIDWTEQSISGTSLTVTVPTHLDGDTLITVLVHSDDAPAVTITPPAGWNLVRDKTNMGELAVSPPVLYIYEREASSEPASYIWSWDLTGGLLGVMLSYRGTDVASPIGQNAVNAQTGTGTDAVAPSVTTTNDNELALWIGWSDDDDGNDPSATLGRGTVRAREMTAAGGNGAFVGIGDENIPSPGATGTATWTLAATEERSGVTITLLPTAGAGGNDTAWKDFGFALGGADSITTIEIGMEWFRNNTAPVLTATISWDGGATWAPTQTATNKSADDDTVQFLDFTSATSWTASKLNDTNLRVRASTNASGGRLDYTTVRVTSIPSRAGTQLDVDTEYDYLFNVTDADGWSDIATDGNVRLNLWYDGNGTPTIDQRDPTACAAIGNDWTNCQDAFSSNNIYSYANGTGITFQRAGGSGQSSTTTIDIGTAGNDRLVVVYGSIETTGQGQLSDVTVDGKSANFIALAQNNAGAGSHTQMWAIDEAALGASNGVVTVTLVGGTGSWGIHVQVFYGVASSTAFDSAIDSTSVDPDNEVKPAVVDIPANGLLVFLAGHGSTGTFNDADWDTSPTEVADDSLSPEIEMTEVTDGFGSGSPGGPFSAVMGTAYWISIGSQQNNRQLRAQTSIDPFSRGSSVIASFSAASGSGGGGTATFNYFDPIEVTPGTASAWIEVDASPYIPSGATGVILHITTSGGEAYGVRKNGSMDDRVRYGIGAQHNWAMIGVDANRTFEANVASTTNVDIWLLGYTGTGVTFFTDAPDKSLGSTGSWIDIDISGDTGADTAIGAIIEYLDTSGNGDFGLRMNGSSDNRVLRQLAHPWAIIGVDANEILEGQITDLGDDFFLVGYVTEGAVFNLNADDVSLGSINTYVDIDISGLTGSNTANGAFIEVINANPGPSRDFALRKNGSAEDIFKSIEEHTWGFVEVDGNEILEGKIDSTDVDFYLVGYSLAGSGVNDFKIQRGRVTIPTSQSTVTITAGTDYVAPASLSRAFIRIVGTRLSGNGDDTGLGAGMPAREWMTSISNPGNLLTSITFERYFASTTDTTRIYWQILEYTGPSGGANEFIVRDQAEIEQTGASLDGASATATDDADVVVFITGQRTEGAAQGHTYRGLYTAEWVAASDLPRFTRGDGTGLASVSYGVVEFTGSNWKVQRAEHTYVSSASEETETITAVVLARTFIHAQMRTAIGNVDEMGQRVRLASTTTVGFQLRSGAGIFSQVGVAWVVENTQTGSNTMNVQRVSGSRTGGGGNPDEWTETITVVADLTTTSIMGETSDSSGTGDSGPRGAVGLNLTATSTVTLWRMDGNNMQDYRFEVVEWPTAPSGGGGGGGGGQGNDTAWRDFGFALSGSITMVEVGIEWWRNNTAPLLNVTVSWDGGTTWAANQTATNKSADDDTVEFLDFTSATAWTPTKLNDANFRVRVGTNASGARLDYVTARVTSSSGGELTFSQQTTGANYRIVLRYIDTADPTTASLSEWSVTEGRATYNASASGLTAIMSGPTLIGYEFRLALKFGFQVKHAVAPTNSAVGAYNDLDSWNGEVVATDGPHTITLQEASTGEHMEFGVFMYTFVNISGDWTVNVFHGSTANTNTVTVFRRSNDDFTLKIWFVTDLIKGGDTIPITNVQILAAGDLTDDITADTAFAGLGEGNAVYILGSATLWFSHSTGTDEDTTTVQFSVTVALGTPLGTYTAQLTIRIQQQP